ncbi:MAG: hypothetical protein E7673_05775 [Ruminococcaceae bacterium]|nr:hypothetical protein [Oscillospiraceae bacterium]
MNITESKNALYEALKNVSEDAVKRGMKAEVRCFVADHDLMEVSEDSPKATLIAGEITVTSDENEDKEILLECALSVEDGEVSSEEMLREVNTIRGSMKEICETFDSVGSAGGTIESIEKEQQVDMPEPKVFDNKNFYIYGGIAAAVVLILVIIFA